jgi:hypothetical protein
MRKSAGVMEWRSNGVMIILFEIKVLAFSNTPILQYSSTPKELVIFTGNTVTRGTDQINRTEL